jgi:hypothetical protein
MPRWAALDSVLERFTHVPNGPLFSSKKRFAISSGEDGCGSTRGIKGASVATPSSFSLPGNLRE